MTRLHCFSVFLFFCFSVFLFSCEQERDPCLQPTTVPLRVVAKQIVSDSSVIDTLLPKPVWIAIDSLRGFQFPPRTSLFQLLLSPLVDTCRYALQPDSSVASFDTLTFFYGRKLQFISNACGYTYFFSLQRINTTKHNIDSVAINNADVTSNANTPEHVQIFF